MIAADRRKALIAQLGGIAERHGFLHRTTRDDALAEITDRLLAAGVRPGSVEAVDLLTSVASTYSNEDPPFEDWWHTDAFALLVAAGADAVRAREPRPTGSTFRFG